MTEKAAKKIQLTITTPRGVKFEETADMVVLRAIDGQRGVLPGHARMSTVLGDGVLRVHNENEIKEFAVFGGLVEIDSDTVDIYTTIAQLPEEIDLERAEEDRARAIKALEERPKDMEIERAQLAMRRSLVRIEIGQKQDSQQDD